MVNNVIKNSNCFLRALCRVVIVTLLSAQAAFATQPCVTPGMSAASAMSGQMGDDCCDMPAAHSSNLCVMNCADSDKLPAPSPLLVPPPPISTILVLPALLDNTRAAVAMCSLVGPVRDPPKTIRFCSFLI